jgi:hypothetical protein
MEKMLEIEVKEISYLRPDPNNARKHDAKNIDAIAKSLARFGQRKPIVIRGDGTIVAGNGTVEAAKQLGWTEIACARVPWKWTADEVKAYALADNRTAELAEWDSGILAEQLLELDAVGWDVADLGFLALRPDTIDDADAFSLLHDGDRNDATQMTFTMTLRQAEILKSCIRRVKESHSFDDSDNKNSNGNAIVTMAEEWMQNVSQRS